MRAALSGGTIAAPPSRLPMFQNDNVGRGMRFLLVTTLLTGSSCLPAAQNERAVSSKYYAIQVDEAKALNPDLIKTLGSQLHAHTFQSDITKRHGILVFLRPDSVSPAWFEAQIKRIESRFPIAHSLRVYAKRRSLAIPSGQIIVEFKEGTPADQANKLLLDQGLQIVVEPTQLRPQRFVVTTPAGADPEAIAGKMSHNPTVSFAEPDLIEIAPPPIQK